MAICCSTHVSNNDAAWSFSTQTPGRDARAKLHAPIDPIAPQLREFHQCDVYHQFGLMAPYRRWSSIVRETPKADAPNE